jgi:hypothetical protein
MRRGVSKLLFSLAITAGSGPFIVFGQSAAGVDLVLLSPLPDTVAISKTPTISFRSSVPILEKGRLVLFDGNDITAMITGEGNVYSYIPVTPISSGNHKLFILAHLEDGSVIERQFSFSSRHTESFEEIYSDNRVSATLRSALTRNLSEGEESIDERIDSATADLAGSSVATIYTGAEFPYTSFDAYLSTDSAVKEGQWTSSARADIRYFDQNAELFEPEKKGLSLLEFLITSKYTGEALSTLLEIGDLSIEESTNTIDYLTRRGGKVSLSVGDVLINGFGVQGQETGYEIEGLGFGFNSNDHIMGGSVEVDFFDRRMSLKSIYVTGGEAGNQLGTWSVSEGRQGDVFGLVWTTDFFSQLLMTEVEYDMANYDFDVGDTEKSVQDKAYRIRFSGFTDTYDYEFGYTYTGPQYEVVGNQSIINDWAGFNFLGGLTVPYHFLHLLLDYSWDNVEDDALFSRIRSLTCGFDYQYSGWQRFPVSFLFDYNRQRSEDEPDWIDPTSLDTYTLTGSLGYSEGPWAAEIRSSYSEQDDTTIYDSDSQLFSVSVVPSYATSFLSILPSWTLNSSKDLFSGIRTETNTLTLDLYSSFFGDRVIGELGGTYDWSEADDGSIDMNNTSLYARLNYRFKQIEELEDTTLALEYLYNRLEDNVSDSTAYEGVLSLVVSTVIPYSL